MLKNHVHVDIRVTGVVQGVWYRKSACEAGTRLGLAGAARNLPDGSVSIQAEGHREAVDAFVAWCRSGPPMAKVEQVDVREGEMIGMTGFTIQR